VAKSDSSEQHKQKKGNTGWVVTIFFMTIVISGTISLISEEVMGASGIATAFVILLSIVLIGILFDVIGVAVTSADESPFEAIRLLRQAEKVSSVCNDVVGDICGVVSGSAAATIAVQILHNFEFSWPRVVSLLMSALVAGLTVGGKAIGKTFAVNSSTAIVHFVGKIIFTATRLFGKKKN